MAALENQNADHSSSNWLNRLLARESSCEYLRKFGSPTNISAFREQVPIVNYEYLKSSIDRIAEGEADLLFQGRPCAFELTGGSSGGPKLIPYTEHGLADFQRAVAPWLASVVEDNQITGKAYFSLSPATRPSQSIGNLPLGLPDGAYLGNAWGRWVAEHSAVPLDVCAERNVEVWKQRTLSALMGARDLELISVWSPTFLIQLIDELPSPREIWPRLKVVSCWASGSSKAFAEDLQSRIPQARIQPKGLLSTECVTTVPGADDRATLNPHGFFEFDSGHEVCLATQVKIGKSYEVIATTASGLYRYRTHDRVICIGVTELGNPMFEFTGRVGIVSDLVGEKLTDEFVCSVLDKIRIPGFRFIAPIKGERGYGVFTNERQALDIEALDKLLCTNPQYAYARKLGQLASVRHIYSPGCQGAYHERQLALGVRLGDIKQMSLILDTSWCATRISA